MATKYIHQPSGSYTSYDDTSEEYAQLSALPKDRRPVFLSETHKDVKAHFEKKAKQSDEALVARATQELLAELVADKVAERVEKLRKKG
jgi:DNA-binding MarR family transcriptional regulator